MPKHFVVIPRNVNEGLTPRLLDNASRLTVAQRRKALAEGASPQFPRETTTAVEQ